MKQKFGRLLSRMLERMTVPYRDATNDYYRFPWF